MDTFVLRPGKRYRATLSLGLLERMATNEMVAARLEGMGFSDVTVSGAGSERTVEVLWNNPEMAGKIPPQITGIVEV